MKTLVAAMVKAIVDHPDEVEISEVIGDHSHVLELRVAEEDLGRVIGKKGVNASAIRILLGAFGGKDKKRYMLRIIEQ